MHYQLMAFSRGVISLTIGCMALFVRPGPASADEFTYRVPEGFVDLSHGAPPENFAQVPSEIADRARTFRGYALLFQDGQVKAEFTVKVGEGTGDVFDSINGIASRAAKQHDQFKILEKRSITLDGLECGHLDFAVRVNGIELRKIVYVLPLGTNRAWMALEVDQRDLGTARGAFEASVHGVSGLTSISDPRAEVARLGSLIGIPALLGVLLRQLFIRRKRSGRRHRRTRGTTSEGS